MRVPSSTPAGTETSMMRSWGTRASPLHLPQGPAMMRPTPLHLGQVRATLKKLC